MAPILLLLLQLIQAAHSNVEERLFSDLFRNYNPAARPVNDPHESVQVAISLALMQLDDLILKDSKMITTGWTTVTWTDERLTWDPDDYDDIEVLVVKPDMIWLPSFTLDNTLGQNFYVEDHYRWFRVSVYNDGTCIWEPGGKYMSHCDVQVTYFPFDRQTCSLVFANWVYSGNAVNLTIAEDAHDTILETYSENGEWSDTGHDISRDDHIYECCPDEPYPEVHFTLHFHRKPLFYVLNIILPSVLLSALGLIVFKLPPESGEKMSTGVTLLLSFSVFLLLVSESVPRTSTGVPIVVVYLLFAMATNCLSLLSQVIVLRVHHSPATSRRLPAWLRRLCCINSGPSSCDGDEEASETSDGTTVKNNSVSPQQQQPGNEEDHGTTNGNPFIIPAEADLVKEAWKTAADDHSNPESVVVSEYKQLAAVLDSILFWIMLCLLVIGAVVILAAVPLMQPKPA